MTREETPPYVYSPEPGVVLTMPGWAVYDLRRWAELGETPEEKLLQAVIRNDLVAAFGYADRWNAPNLGAFAAFVYNELPSACWRTERNIAAWAKKFDKGPGLTYPPGWPACPGCGRPALDGHITCGDVDCDEGGRR